MLSSTHTLQNIIEYPKLLCLLLCCVFSYVLFHVGAFDSITSGLHAYGYLSVFLAGLLFSFGFTTPFAIGMFIAMAPDVHPLIAAPIGGIGALASDMTIFKFVRFSLHDEFDRIRHVKFVRKLLAQHKRLPGRVQEYFLWSVAGIIIASPLPDELATTLLGGLTDIDSRKFAILCFALNTIGILLMLVGAQVLL
ncbi:MAG: hypothetical protein KBD00_06110 [Candidatus Peribacteraceae bacterium]|nr:hypothetical protein [Candidatus Peribacteraceae bacterium]